MNKVPSRNLESGQLGMVKKVLRINRSSTDEFVRGELGLVELEMYRGNFTVGGRGCWVGRGQVG